MGTRVVEILPAEMEVDDVPRRRVWDFSVAQLYNPRGRCAQTLPPHIRMEDAPQALIPLQH